MHFYQEQCEDSYSRFLRVQFGAHGPVHALPMAKPVEGWASVGGQAKFKLFVHECLGECVCMRLVFVTAF